MPGGESHFPFPDEEVQRLTDQWNLLQFEVRTGNERSWRRGLQWVLVHSFGDEDTYHHDPEFHARVQAAWQMINRLVEARDEAQKCPVCDGSGITLVNDGDDHMDEVSCWTCSGTGRAKR